MPGPFRFKNFTVAQERAAMKVGTDGVLLGAWCNVENRQTALDIGTGTGLIALMLAQRNDRIYVTALEPDSDAIADAQVNFKNSKWGNRLRIIPAKIADFQSYTSFDLIVSNPPFFQNSLKPVIKGRHLARHADDFDHGVFAQCAKLLSEKGVMAGIYPPDIYEKFYSAASAVGLHPYRICKVQPTSQKICHRIMFEFGLEKPKQTTTEILVIESNGRHIYSEEYKLLTREFYLDF